MFITSMNVHDAQKMRKLLTISHIKKYASGKIRRVEDHKVWGRERERICVQLCFQNDLDKIRRKNFIFLWHVTVHGGFK